MGFHRSCFGRQPSFWRRYLPRIFRIAHFQPECPRASRSQSHESTRHMTPMSAKNNTIQGTSVPITLVKKVRRPVTLNARLNHDVRVTYRNGKNPQSPRYNCCGNPDRMKVSLTCSPLRTNAPRWLAIGGVPIEENRAVRCLRPVCLGWHFGFSRQSSHSAQVQHKVHSMAPGTPT